MCEEVQDPSKQVPKAIVGTIILNTLAGLVFLIPLVFVLPNTEYLIALASGQPVPSIMKSAIGNSGGAFVLLIPLAVLAILCGIGCTTAVSRSVFAFARDGGIPYSNQWRKVNKSLSIPFNAMMLGMAVEIALGLIYFGSSTAFSAFSGVGVITLTVSYACPIAVSFIGGRRQIKNGQFDLGGLGVFCNIVALGMILLRQTLHACADFDFLSLEHPCRAAVLYAFFGPCHCGHSQLCACRVRWLYPPCNGLVLGLGAQEIRWTTYGRRCSH